MPRWRSTSGSCATTWPDSTAHARMLARQGIIPADDAERIAAGLAQVADELESGQGDLGSRSRTCT